MNFENNPDVDKQMNSIDYINHIMFDALNREHYNSRTFSPEKREFLKDAMTKFY